MNKVKWIFAIMFFATFSSAWGMTLSIYLYGSRAYLPYIVKSHDVYVEESALMNALRLSPDLLKPASNLIKQGKTYVSLTDVASILHSEILINPKTGIVDLFGTQGAWTSGLSDYQIPSQTGPTEVIPPSASESWQNCSPISCLPLNPLPPPAVNIVPLVGNPWYNYPSYAPDPYYGSSIPSLYENNTNTYYPWNFGAYSTPRSIAPPAQISGGTLPENSQGVPITSYSGPGFDFHPTGGSRGQSSHSDTGK